MSHVTYELDLVIIHQSNSSNSYCYVHKVLKAMRESDSIKPAIFAMSNPTMNGKSLQSLLSSILNLWLLQSLY